jgi:S1-C subfamily serine protease
VEIAPISESDRKAHFVPSDVSGIIVRSVAEGSPAAKIGIKEGDVILSIDGNPVRTPEDVTNALKDVKWGDTRQIKYARYGKYGRALSDVSVKF